MVFYNSSDPYEEFLEIPEMNEINLEYDNIMDNLKELPNLVKNKDFESALDLTYSCFDKYWKPELDAETQIRFYNLMEIIISLSLSANSVKKAAYLYDNLYEEKMLKSITPHYNMHYLQAVIWIFTGRFTYVKPNIAIGDELIQKSEDQSSVYAIIGQEMYDVWPKQRIEVWNDHMKNYYKYKISILMEQ
jgi:hypothetical protein